MNRASSTRLILAAALVCALLALVLIPRSAGSPPAAVPSDARAPARAGLVPWRGGSGPVAASRARTPFERLATVRSLDDPSFGPSVAELGMYDPEAFLEAAPQLLYALEPDFAYKTPVVFVHGLGGSARDFAALVANLDRARYKPWFFHYPSGLALDQSAQLFYELLLARGSVPGPEAALIVVGHDMGGLIVREALNLSGSSPGEARVRLLVSVATPFAGRRSAEQDIIDGAYAAPVWRDLEPGSRFMAQLFRARLPARTLHAAVYAYLEPRQLTRGSAHDGVVTVASQLAGPAHAQLTRLAGFQASHSSILRDPSAVHWVLAAIDELAGVDAEPPAPALATSQP